MGAVQPHSRSRRRSDWRPDPRHHNTDLFCFELLVLALRITAGGCIVAGPPRSLLVFLSSSVHACSAAQPDGDIRHWTVRSTNHILTSTALVRLIAQQRGVRFAMEPPTNSFMFKTSIAMRLNTPSRARMVSTSLYCFGHDMPNCTHLLGTLPLLARRHRQLRVRRCPRSTKQFTRATPGCVAGEFGWG